MDDPEIILSGPSETGKTIAGLHRLHKLAMQYPVQAVIVRKYHVDLHKTVLRTFENKIIHPSDGVRIYGGKKAEWYDYPDSGARIYAAGLDRNSAVLSGEFDIIYFNQAEEGEGADWETLGTRTTGRAGNIANPALWGDCNPYNQDHWILRRARDGILKLLPTTHRDNPALYDAEGNLTPQGVKTIGRLSKLTGVRLARLFEGKWVTPEGTIYSEFDRNIHVKHRDPKEFQYQLLALDAGFDHPAVILLIGVDADLRAHIAKEFYESGVLPSRHANTTLRWSRQYHAGLAIVDPSAAGLIAELRNAGMKVETPSMRDVEQGIDLVHELLAVQADKKPRLTVDPECVNTINEFESYRRIKGRIVKENDHSLDSLRYFCSFTFAGESEHDEVVYDRVEIGRW